MKQILIVEDDKALSQGIVLSLQGQGDKFKQCFNLGEARQALNKASWDLIILDIGLPDGSGLSLCKEIRETAATPILFLTANDGEYDEVAGFEAGGDDYITKPFSLAILRARVQALLRRGKRKESPKFVVDDMVLDFQAMIFTKGEREITLSKTEQRLLWLLVQNPGRTLTRDILLDKVWQGGEFVDENTLSVAVRRLRTKLEPDPKNPQYIQTVYGLGYRWREEPQ